MSLNKYTKVELLEMLSSKGIDAKPSMKKDALIEFLGPSNRWFSGATKERRKA